ncbi:MAG: hypothetical protein LBU66_03180 [Treponema sp.]|jgi:hypothetical protein|nr:hypothetical protein [Treponema sp.]
MKDNPNDDPQTSGQGDPNQAGKKTSKGNKPELHTIEEHAKNLKVDASVFTAVMQSNKWASGKRVPEAAFKKAVDGFLKAPMGGIASEGGA